MFLAHSESSTRPANTKINMAEQTAEPAAKKQKLEDKDPLWMLSPAELKRVVDFVIQKSATAMDVDAMKQILKDAEAEFLPDVSKYIGKIYVSLHIELAGGEANGHFITTREDWERVKEATEDDAFRLGDVCGKHSDISIGFHPDYWIYSIEEQAVSRPTAARPTQSEGQQHHRTHAA